MAPFAGYEGVKHLARPLVLLALAFASGIAVAYWLQPAAGLTAALTGAALLLGALAWWRGAAGLGVALLLVATLGAGALRWTWVEALVRGNVGSWLGHVVALEGAVRDVATLPGMTLLTVAVAAVHEGGERLPAGGLVQVQLTRPAQVLPGQRALFSGRLMPLTSPNPDRLPPARERGVYWQLTRVAPPRIIGTANGLLWLSARLRQRLTSAVAAALPAQQAALLNGLLFSEGSLLPAAQRADFKRTGLAHILAVDGGKVGAVLAAMLWLPARLGWSRRRAGLAAVPVLVTYCMLAGGTAPAVRATVMALAGLAALVLHRRADTPSALALAALGLLVADPHNLTELGFQLSMAATIGILLFCPPLLRSMARLPHWLAEPLAVTLAVELGVEPLGLHAFGGVPVLSPIVHLWAMPLLAVLVPLGGLTALSAALWPPLAWLPGRPTAWLLSLLTWSTGLVARLPLAYWQPGKLPVVGTVVAYAVLAGLAWALRRRRRRITASVGAGDVPSGGAPATR